MLEPARAVYAAARAPTRHELQAAASQMAVFQARLSLSDFGDDSGVQPADRPRAEADLGRGASRRTKQEIARLQQFL